MYLLDKRGSKATEVIRDVVISAKHYDIAELVSRNNIIAERIVENLRRLERKIQPHRSQLQVKG